MQFSLAGLGLPPRLRANNTHKVVFVQFDDETNGGKKGYEVRRKIEMRSETGIVTLWFLSSLN